MYCFQASLPDSRPPPVAFSPPKAPPISAPEVGMFTLTIPQSEPLGPSHCTKEPIEEFQDVTKINWSFPEEYYTLNTLPRSFVKIEEDSPCSTCTRFYRNSRSEQSSQLLLHLVVDRYSLLHALHRQHVNYRGERLPPHHLHHSTVQLQNISTK